MITSIPNPKAGCSLPLPTLLATAVTLLLTGCATVGGGPEDLIDEAPVTDIGFSSEDEIDFQGAAVFERRVYGTAGAGGSRLTPNTDQATGTSVADENDPAWQVGLGADLSNTFSIELHGSNLGSAKLDPTGRIGYDIYGGSVLAYAGKQRGERRGFMGYGRAGIAVTDIEAIGDITFESEDGAQGLVGAGLEYMGRNLGIRGEIILFDRDAQFANLGVVYRLGVGGGTDELPETLPPATLPVEPLNSPPPAIPETSTPQPPVTDELLDDLTPLTQAEVTIAEDQDADGIPDEFDTCPATAAGVTVDDTGCAIFNGIVDGVNFERGSAILTANARTVLDGVIDTLSQYPDALVTIAAHTDGTGREEDNLALSRDRAISVARYLITRGVPKALMSARAFGEYQPIADNGTAEGRALNRRVEIVASNQTEN